MTQATILLMVMINRLSHLRVDRSVYMVQIILAITLMIDYAVSTTIDDWLGGWFYILPVAAIALVLIFPTGDYTARRVKQLLLILNHSAVAVLLLFFTDVFGPYFQLLILLLFAAAAWHGTKGIALSLLASYVTVALAGAMQFGLNSPDDWQLLSLYLIGLTALAIMLEGLHDSQKLQPEHDDSGNASVYLERTRLLSLINSMADAVVATDRDGKILLYNGAALELFNTNESLYSRRVQEMLELSQPGGKPYDLIADAKSGNGTVVRDDIFFYANDDSEIDLNISVSPVSSPGSSREQAGFILVLRDITKQKTLDEQRDEFISIASHELRTPIAIAEANISTAMLPKFAPQLTEEGSKLLEQAHENVLFLSNLVNDLHVLAQAEKGRLQVEINKIKPDKFLETLVSDYRSQAEEKGLLIEVETEDDLPTIKTSLDAVREIMQNFITNAIKYTEKGTITLMVKKDEEGGAVFAVRDTGIGISATDQKHIFEKFYRSEDYRTRKNGGTGLGLYITRRLIERMGGKVWFESKLNKGSTFYCSLPSTPQFEQKS